MRLIVWPRPLLACSAGPYLDELAQEEETQPAGTLTRPVGSRSRKTTIFYFVGFPLTRSFSTSSILIKCNPSLQE